MHVELENAEALCEIILAQYNSGEFLRIAPRQLVRRVRTQHPDIPSNQIQAAIRHLVNRGELIYSHRFSSTQLEQNFRRCVAVSPKIMLCPEEAGIKGEGHDVLIRLSIGEAFGLGDHPTTRLALKGIEFAVRILTERGAVAKASALDIGTGSGVLALAAAMLGIGQVHAIDNDPVARHEASENIKRNAMEGRVRVDSKELELMPAREFCLIMANLRPPTLRRLFGGMARLARPPALWVLSGFRTEERGPLTDMLERQGASILWCQEEKDWAAFVTELSIKALAGVEYGS